MSGWRAREGADDESGAIAILVAIFAVAMFGFASIVVDLGYARTLKSDRENAVDAASLAAAGTFNGAASDSGDSEVGAPAAAPAAAQYQAAIDAVETSFKTQLGDGFDLSEQHCPAPDDGLNWQHFGSGTNCVLFLAQGAGDTPPIVRVALPPEQSPTFIAGALGISTPIIDVVSYAQPDADETPRLRAAPPPISGGSQ